VGLERGQVLVEDKLGMEVASEGVVLHVGRGILWQC
jgi:hypothetical protein